MGKKEDKKDKSKGLVYVTNGETKTPGLPDPEMTAPSDDVSSEGLPRKNGRRCGRYRCLIVAIACVIVVAAVACAVYFSVTLLIEDDKKAANSSMTANTRREETASLQARSSENKLTNTEDDSDGNLVPTRERPLPFPTHLSGAGNSDSKDPPMISNLMPDLSNAIPIGSGGRPVPNRNDNTESTTVGTTEANGKGAGIQPIASQQQSLTPVRVFPETVFPSVQGQDGQRSQGQGRTDSVPTVTMTSTTEGGPNLNNPGSLERGVPGRPGVPMVRGIMTEQPQTTVASTEGPSSNQGAVPLSSMMRRRAMPGPPPAPVNQTETESGGDTADTAEETGHGGGGTHEGSPSNGANSESGAGGVASESETESAAGGSDAGCQESGDGASCDNGVPAGEPPAVVSSGGSSDSAAAGA